MSKEYLNNAVIGNGLSICGLPPDKALTTVDDEPCDDCGAIRVVRKFSGSGWYEDFLLCANCGFDVGTGYKPFKRGWRDANKKRAESWLETAIDFDTFHSIKMESIREEMGWDD